MAKSTLVETMKAYREAAAEVTALEKKKGALKDTILEEMEARGVKTLVAGEYVATLSTYDRESVALKELVQEFGRDLLKEKKLLNTYPVQSLKVDKT